MFNIRKMKPEDKAVIMPMVSTFYHSPAVEHDVDTAVLERTFDAATDPTMPYISGLVMLEDEKVVGYGYVTVTCLPFSAAAASDAMIGELPLTR